MRSMTETDLVIVGGGPAGAAAAIAARSRGLRVVVLERNKETKVRPGEGAHPGIEPLLLRLGVMDAVSAANFLRYKGHWVAWGGQPQRFMPFGQDERGAWEGFQLPRLEFDTIMLEGARKAGALVVQPTVGQRLIVEADLVKGVETEHAVWRCSFVIDATGRHRWLSRALKIPVTLNGPRRIAWFDYANGECPALDSNPKIVSDARGWTWMARIRPGLYQCVRIPLNGSRPSSRWRPDEFADLHPCEGRRGIDVSSSIATQTAGPGYFLVGDAASVTDPLSSHGVLKAVMSGINAAHYSALITHRIMNPGAAATAYNNWLTQWFRRDCARLDELYHSLV
jgi:flavin-dependent dehydrogenase